VIFPVEKSAAAAPDFLKLAFCRSPNRSAVTLDFCLSAYLTREQLTGDDGVECEMCSALKASDTVLVTDHVKQLFIQRLPDVFFLSLKRFQRINGKTQYISRVFDVPLQYNFGSHYVDPSHEDTFRIYAVVYYIHPVHYVALIQSSDGSWMRCDDDSVERLSPESAREEIRKRGYLFFWRRCTSSSSNASDDVLDITDAVSDQGNIVEVHTITTGDVGFEPPVFDESSDSDLDFVGSRVVDESSISMQVEKPGLPFTLPRHFCFKVGALKTLAPILVQNQNSAY
jgi:hypothetical protein